MSPSSESKKSYQLKLDGQIYEVEIDGDKTLRDLVNALKEKVSENRAADLDTAKLVLNGKILNNDTLCSELAYTGKPIAVACLSARVKEAANTQNRSVVAGGGASMSSMPVQSPMNAGGFPFNESSINNLSKMPFDQISQLAGEVLKHNPEILNDGVIDQFLPNMSDEQRRSIKESLARSFSASSHQVPASAAKNASQIDEFLGGKNACSHGCYSREVFLEYALLMSQVDSNQFARVKTPISEDERLSIYTGLENMGFTDKRAIDEAIKVCGNDLDAIVNFLLDRGAKQN